jgi:hypothetical protein
MIRGDDQVKSLSLYDRTSPLGGMYILFTVNRLQMLYFILIMPLYLVHPYMIWAIVVMGIFSQLNLMLLSKWFSSDISAKGYQGFVQLLGERMVRFFALIGLIFFIFKITVITLGYVEIVHQFIFPTMDRNWLVLSIVLISCYVAAQGMEKTIQFIVTVFLCSVWIIIVYIPFFLPPIASIHDLYPLIPTDWSSQNWRGLLFIWSSLSGSEYLICLVPWLKPKQQLTKYLTIANTISVVEYLFLFVASLLFYGSHYLSKNNYPVVNMIRYLQSPVFERIDIILISVHMFHYVFVISIFLLYFYGAIRVILGRLHKQTTRIGYVCSCITFLGYIIVVNEWFWKAGAQQNTWHELQIWLGAITFLLVPVLLFAIMKVKGRA